MEISDVMFIMMSGVWFTLNTVLVVYLNEKEEFTLLPLILVLQGLMVVSLFGSGVIVGRLIPGSL